MKKYNGKGLKCQDRNTEITTSYRDRQNRFNIGKLTWYIADNRWEQREAKSKLKPPSPLHPPSSTSSHWGAHGSRELRLLPSPCSPQHHSQLGSAQRWVPLEPTPGLGQLLGSAQWHPRSPLATRSLLQSPMHCSRRVTTASTGSLLGDLNRWAKWCQLLHKSLATKEAGTFPKSSVLYLLPSVRAAGQSPAHWHLCSVSWHQCGGSIQEKLVPPASNVCCTVLTQKKDHRWHGVRLDTVTALLRSKKAVFLNK